MKKFVEENYENMVTDLTNLVKHKSVYSDDELPFGSENKAVLDEALNIMKRLGFNTENVDYYAGFGEIGKGDKTIGIVCHLDVVPVGDGWESDPFTITKKGNRLYGRGVSDDKGAAVASMYAMKYLLDTNYPLKKKVRLILGCNEETGSKCIKHYVEKYGHVDMGFTPDGDFPGIYGEKGMISLTLRGHNSKIIDIKGGEATNIVCKKVECKVPLNSFDEEKFVAFLNNEKIKYELNHVDDLKITVYGKSAHASTPELGINAINYLMEALFNADFNDSYVDMFHKCFGLNLHGEKLGFESLKDEVTDTSTSVGLAYKDGNDICIKIDLRFPITAKLDDALKLVKDIKDNDNVLECGSAVEPLYFDKNLPMIKSLLKAYQDVTGDKTSEMMAIGGGTYAKSMHNIIAFGCEFDSSMNHIHDANESLDIDEFKKQVLIYIEAIKNLNEV